MSVLIFVYFRQTQFRHSSDILDMLPSCNGGRIESAKARSRIDQVEEGLFIGNMDAATDIVNLEIHRVTHIVTVGRRT